MFEISASPSILLDPILPIFQTQVLTLGSLGQVQTDEGYADDAVETYLQVLSLQEAADPDEVADAHVQASVVGRQTLETILHMCGEWGAARTDPLKISLLRSNRVNLLK